MKAAMNCVMWGLMLAATVTGTRAPVEAQGPELREGQDLWRSCAACHCVPDSRIPQDENWLRLNETTTCISGERDTPEGRRSLISYLRATETLRPLLIDEQWSPPQASDQGRIRVPATAGSAYLKAERMSVRKGSPPRIRLAWKTSEEGKALAIPAGDYRVISYSFYRADEERRAWCVSGTSAEGCAAVTIESDREASLDLVPEIHGHLSTTKDEKTEGGIVLGFFMTNAGGDRVSIACNGKLVNPTWIISDAAGETVAAGDFEVT